MKIGAEQDQILSSGSRGWEITEVKSEFQGVDSKESRDEQVDKQVDKQVMMI